MCEPHVDSASRYRVHRRKPANKAREDDCILDVNKNESSPVTNPDGASANWVTGVAGN